MYNIVFVCFFLTGSDDLTKVGPAQKIGETTFNAAIFLSQNKEIFLKKNVITFRGSTHIVYYKKNRTMFCLGEAAF